ncbi:MAG: chemotaxis protein CheW [Deltaproteobacteria bacterium]|nr:chemotaxis protein CheW [Deltaproteobacteria bacterium]
MPSVEEKKEIESANSAAEDSAFAAKTEKSGLAPTEEDYRTSLENIGESALQVISFYLNADEYAFEITEAFEVMKPKEYTEVPLTPDFIKGVISVRGEMVALIDLKARLNIPGLQGEGVARPPRILIAGHEEHRAGFLVDGIGGVRELPDSSLKDAAGAGVKLNGFAKASALLGGNRLVVLDLKKLLDAPL